MKTFNKAKFLVILPLIVSAGCMDWFKGGKSNVVEPKGKDDLVLITLGGKPAMTRTMLDEEFKKLLDENPQYKAILEMMPDAKLNFLKGWAQQLAIDEWVKKNGIENTPAYKDELEHMMVSLKRMLNTKHFGLSLKVELTPEELLKFYNENKDKAPDWVLARGGVKAVGIKFDKEADAKAFLAKAKEGFEKAAKDAKLTIEDFKVVHQGSMIDPTLRAEILKFKKFPGVEFVKVNDKAFYIVNATSKSDTTEYKPLEEVKDQIKQIIENKKRQELFASEVEKLIKEFAIEIKADALPGKQPEEAKPAEMKAEENKAETPVKPEAPAAPVVPEAKEVPAAA